MATIFLTFAGLSAAPALIARNLDWALALGVNAMVWTLCARVLG